SILRMLDHYQELLGSIVEDRKCLISDLSIVTKTESIVLLEKFNATKVSYPLEETFVSLFETQVRKSPESIAVVLGDVSMSYQELDERSNQVSHYLQTQGVVRDCLVGICLDRSVSMLVGILGILKSGGAYVPIKRDYPLSRISHILEEIGSPLVLTDQQSAPVIRCLGHEVLILDSSDSLFRECPVTAVVDITVPDSLAYVIYTSGSTGVPKGAMIEHAGMLNHLLLMIDELDMD
ncbi:AMP-binding protein, partial [Flavivirga jejuensis]|uniref:AMP-binding protein n=1 Tax=Flavivirga jejuensis TaxID=870487 RepID=UPI0031EA6103